MSRRLFFSPSNCSGSVHGESLGGSAGIGEEVTVPGRKPWDHLAGCVSCGRPPSPPRWAPSLPAGCCTASSSHPVALLLLCASPVCPLPQGPERKKQVEVSVTEMSQTRDTERWMQTQIWQLKLFFLPSSTSPSSSPHPLSHCCQSHASCSFYSSFSSFSLSSSYPDASGNGNHGCKEHTMRFMFTTGNKEKPQNICLLSKTSVKWNLFSVTCLQQSFGLFLLLWLSDSLFKWNTFWIVLHVIKKNENTVSLTNLTSNRAFKHC